MAGNKPASQRKCAGDRVLNGPGNFRRAVDLDAGIAPVEKLARRYVGVMIGGAVDQMFTGGGSGSGGGSGFGGLGGFGL